jgi:hypothetical protein
MNRYRNRKSEQTETENFRSPLKSVKTCKTEISPKKQISFVLNLCRPTARNKLNAF